MTDIDRQAILNQLKQDLGLFEREDDEFTARELTDTFGINPTNLMQFFEINEVQYSRRKAMADGRRQYVYRIERDKE